MGVATYGLHVGIPSQFARAQQPTDLFDVAKEELLLQVVALIEDDRWQQC
jgi:hypothetical protein